MPYTTNPMMPRLRAKAVDMVHAGKSIRQVARYFGFQPSSISRWVKKVPKSGSYLIPTQSSRPKTHPKRISVKTRNRIRDLRIALKGRCGEIIHQHLLEEGVKVSLRTVQRELDRLGMLKKRNGWQKQHVYPKRPEAKNPGDLVQIDTVHFQRYDGSRYYVYTLVDVYSRWSFAWATDHLGARRSLKFIRMAQKVAKFQFKCLQSDHGPEFQHIFTSQLTTIHRYSRIRRPNDNAHLERFNRTLQEECLNRLPDQPLAINKGLPVYLKYFNTQRKHLGLNYKTPHQKLEECCEGVV